MAGNVGLTDKQNEELNELIQRNLDYCNKKPGIKPLTDIMAAKVVSLTNERDNPELPTGAKTYCKKWLKSTEFDRWPEISSKYIEKGNLCEEDGFTLLCVQLKLGMVFKNEQWKKNSHINGTWDLLVDGVVYDNKASWDLDTFPMYENKPDPGYVWQLQGYMELTGTDRAVLGHTLIDTPEKLIYDSVKWVDDLQVRAKIVKNMVFTQAGWERASNLFFESLPTELTPKFIPVPDNRRIKSFPILRDNIAIGSIYHRVNMCNSYINSLISNSNS